MGTSFVKLATVNPVAMHWGYVMVLITFLIGKLQSVQKCLCYKKIGQELLVTIIKFAIEKSDIWCGQEWFWMS